MIKRIGIAVILSFSVLLTAAAAGPRIYSHSLPPTITFGSLSHVIEDLYRMTPVDRMYLKVDSNGGLIAEMERFLAAKKAAKGKLVCTIDYIAASAAAVVTQACDEVHIKPNARLLFHMPRTIESEARGDEILVRIKVLTSKTKNPALRAYLALFKARLKAYKVDDILTGKEWKRMIRGEDVILTGKQYQERDPDRVRIKK